MTYCTARISSPTAAQQRQDAYLEALRRSGSVDLIEEGLFVERYAELPLATRGKDNRPVLVRKAGRMQFVGVSRREEKGSDVNVATHLVVDALDGEMDAAVVISNDSDLALAIRLVRDRMPVGTINPQPTRAGVANALRPPKLAGSGHWFDQLAFADFTASQLPDPGADKEKPGAFRPRVG